jgi:hypothetical protein
MFGRLTRTDWSEADKRERERERERDGACWRRRVGRVTCLAVEIKGENVLLRRVGPELRVTHTNKLIEGERERARTPEAMRLGVKEWNRVKADCKGQIVGLSSGGIRWRAEEDEEEDEEEQGLMRAKAIEDGDDACRARRRRRRRRRREQVD